MSSEKSVKKPEFIQDYPIEKLIPYARNARTHSEAQVAQIAASIREFGFTNPVLIDAEDGIIAGHGRVLAALKLDLKLLPVIRLGYLTEDQKRAYIIADNKLALNAGWDEELLRLELEALKSVDFDLEYTGFGEDELMDILDSKETTGERAPEISRDHAISKSGDVWLLGAHKLICGDMNSHHCDVIIKRWQEYTGEKAVLADK